MLGVTTSSDESQSDEVLEQESIKGPLQATTTLDSVVDIFGCQVGPPRIVAGGTGVLLVEDGLVLLKALHLGVVNILGKGNESRRRSIGGRHFVWRMG